MTATASILKPVCKDIVVTSTLPNEIGKKKYFRVSGMLLHKKQNALNVN